MADLQEDFLRKQLTAEPVNLHSQGDALAAARVVALVKALSLLAKLLSRCSASHWVIHSDVAAARTWEDEARKAVANLRSVLEEEP